MKVQAEKTFSVPANEFSITPSTSGYSLAYSADGKTFNEHTVVPANENLLCVGFPKFVIFKLVGNTDEVTVKW